MSTGINIKRLTNIVFLTSSKSFSRTIQSIGRTLRLHDSKTEAHLIDVSWKMKYS
jgi:superfamily II DNA or RNA helicase